MPLIVLEGLDGAGKSTQLNLLRERAIQKGYSTEFLHFPRIDTPVWGELIARFLRGELGDIETVDPQIVALLFAGDRRDTPELCRWLDKGAYVFLDRYVYSNVAYQCAKLDAKNRDDLIEWILRLEFVYFEIPRPDLSIFVNVPFSFTRQKLLEVREGTDRDYLQGNRDIHEASLELQRRVRDVYLGLASREVYFGEGYKNPPLRIVDCFDSEENMLSPEAIHEKIVALANDMFTL
ncbi:MAG: thymidylate kinase [Alistipes sp.]|jgi:dTMP kinase|nr:thymidylate kinase [Alistipes sp.]